MVFISWWSCSEWID